MPLLLIESLIIFLFVREFFTKLVTYLYFSYVVVKLKKITIKPNTINFIKHQKFINSNIYYNTNFTTMNTSLHK
jgi:hypothetical protein